MTLGGILAGSARAVSAAFESGRLAAFDVRGALIIGPGEASDLVIARAPNWHELDLAALKGEALLLAEPPPNGPAARAVLEAAVATDIEVFLLEGRGPRPLRLDDLLGPRLADVDWVRIRAAIAGKRVLITGGGGSIGGELARRIAGLAPARLTLLDSSEHNLHEIGLELRDARLVLADIRDEASMRRWFGREMPEIVFHAAALKHVPMVEAFPSEGVLTNICGLRNVTVAAHGVGADLIFVSTDKAVEPSGAMGATKRFGELYCQALDRRGPRRAIPVRLGNVLGSSGSVTPLFEAQLAAGGPLTVTHPEATRYFLSIPQAADALLHAAAKGFASQRRGVVKVIEMGEALPVVELARSIIRLAGKRAGDDVAIVFTGLRPGEKLHEQLVARYERRESDAGSGVIAAISAPREISELNDLVERLAMLARSGQDDAVRDALFDAIGVQAQTDQMAAVG